MAQTVRDVFESLTPVWGHNQKSRPGPPGLMSTQPIKASPVQEEWPGCVGSWTSRGFPRGGTAVWDAAPGAPAPCAAPGPHSRLRAPGRGGGLGVRVVVGGGSHSGEDAAGPGDPPQTHVALAPATSWKWGRNDQGLISFLFSWQGTLY